MCNSIHYHRLLTYVLLEKFWENKYSQLLIIILDLVFLFPFLRKCCPPPRSCLVCPPTNNPLNTGSCLFFSVEGLVFSTQWDKYWYADFWFPNYLWTDKPFFSILFRRPLGTACHYKFSWLYHRIVYYYFFF